MYFYNFLLLVNNILILTIQTQSQKPKGPGISGCTFFATANEECGALDVKINEIPEACSSILYDGAYVDLRYHVFADSCGCDRNDKILGYINEIVKSGKRTYLYYGHNSPQEWTQVLFCEAINNGVNSLDEMKGLKAFLDEHPGITGLVLMGLEYDSYSIEFPEYSENLKKYLEVMKTSFPELEIGVDFSASFLIDQITNPQFPWLDFKVIDPAMDFYIISVKYLNDCTAELIDTGIAPMSSSNTNYTMEKVKSVLTQLCIPKEKTYIGFRLNPMSDPNDSNTLCNMTIQKICLDKTETKTWCSDNVTSFNEKGQFAKENGVGFVTSSINLNDPTNLCKCEKPFASFYALLDGFNGVTSKPWLDFKVIDPAMDFYIISVKYLNDCTAELIDTGIAPISSSNTNYTMEKVKSVLTQLCIPTEKIYFGFRLNPISDPNDSNTRCNVTIQEICLDKAKTRDWCSDNVMSFNEKGRFAKENGVGFITSNIAINDPTNLCKCEKPFASFYALLDGFNGVTSKPCDSFSRV